MKCARCDTEPTQVGAFWVCPEHGPVSPEKPFAPLRIFLSYGHDENEKLVRRIKADLEKRGHDVWFDKSQIKFGDDWRRSITDGIAKSHKFVSFLSKHSTRDPGVCRDEIAIAIGVKGGNIQTILVESEAEVQPPVNIGHVQWLDMHDWKEAHGAVHSEADKDGNAFAAGDADWESWYQTQFSEIVRVVESEESRRFAGEIEKLNEYLKPIKSEARICQLLSKGFYGREWLFDAVENWRKDLGNTSRLFWIMGDPGVGKSAFAAQLTHTRSDAVIAAQFVQWHDSDHRDTRRVIRSIASQLATRLPDYRKLLLTLPEIGDLDRKNADELFDYLLANPLRSGIGGGRDRYVIVVDALDEAGESGRNPLVEMLARHAQRLPDWLGLVVTSRPENDVKSPLQGLSPTVLDTRTEANRADLRDYIQPKLAPQLKDRTDADRIIEQILEKSEGVFLYVERFCDDVQQNHLSLDRPEQFPQGLGGIFCLWFQRQFPDLEKFRKDVRPALRAILAAREPLPLEILQRLFHWQDEELHDFTRTLGSLFPVTEETDGEVIKPYHKSLADWLADETKAGMHFVSVKEGRRVMAKFCWEEYQTDFHRVSRYAMCHARSHFMEEPSVAYDLLDESQLNSLLRNDAFILPVVLFAGLESLRWCSSFEQRSQRIAQFPCPIAGDLLPISPIRVFRQIIKWIINDSDSTTVNELLTTLACSRNGLSECELLQLIDGEHVKTLQLLNKLRPLFTMYDSLMFFFHHSFYRAVCEEYFDGQDGLRIATHRKLARYFLAQEPNKRSLVELEWQQTQMALDK